MARACGILLSSTLVLGLAGCRPSPTLATPTPAPLFRAQPIVSATASPAPTATPGATRAPVPVFPTATAFCVNDARFVADLTVPDGTIVLPGEQLDKRWSVVNAGSCDWGVDYRLVREGTGAIEGPAEMALYPARAGAAAEWRVALRAPEAPGEYLARWRARAPEGSFFGEEVFVLIFVEAPTATPSPTVSPTP